MSLRSFLRSFLPARRSRTITWKVSRYWPVLEMLEDRLAPAIFTVTTNADAGAGSLRQAILDANLDAVADTINFSAALNGQTITLGGTELSIKNPLTINGPGAALLKIDANNASRIFNVDDTSGGTTIAVAISGLTFTKGTATAGGAIRNSETLTVTNSTLSGNSASFGGAIVNVGTLTVTNSTLSGNSAGDGGGIFNNIATLTVTNSTVSGNSVGGNGGGIGNVNSTLTVTNSTLSGNSAGANGGGIDIVNSTLTVTNSTLSGNSAGGIGGGIDNTGTFTVTNSTLSGNSAGSSGGGIFSSGTLAVANSTLSGNSAGNIGGGIFNNSGAVTVTNSTLSGNSAAGFNGGGGIGNFGTLVVANSTLSGNSSRSDGAGISNNGTLTATNCTIVSNRANSDGVGSEIGGGVFTSASRSSTLFNTIVAGNLTGAGTPDDLNGPTIVQAASSNNLIGDPGSRGGLINNSNGNIVGKNSGADLLPLAEILDPTLRNNGGPTSTHALIPGSAAIDAGGIAAVTPTSEVQTVTLSGAVSGAFTLTFNGQTTSALSGTATAIQVQGALSGLGMIGGVGGSVAVTLIGSTYTVTFGSSLANTDVAQMTAIGSGGLNTAAATTTNGRPGLFTDQRGTGFPRIVGANVDIGAYEMPRPLFTDNFNRVAGDPLGAPWATQAGGFGIAGAGALGNTANANIATLAGFTASDVDLYTRAGIFAGSQSGLIARFSDVNNYYAATVSKEASGLITARLVKFVGGVYTELAVAEGTVATGDLRLRIVGATLQMFLNGSLLASALDFSLAAGSVGIRTFGNSTHDNFQAWPITTGVDNFDSFSQADNVSLSAPWVRNQGLFLTVGNRIQGGQALNLATIDAANVADVDVRASISITGINHQAGLVARLQGSSYYLALLVRTSSGFTAQVFRNVNGGFTLLASTSVASASGKTDVRFLVTGTNLKFFVNGTQVGNAFDAMLTTGSAGIFGDNYGFLDDVRIQAVTTDLTFTDSYTQADGTSLSTHWTTAAGDFSVKGNKAVPALTNVQNVATLTGAKVGAVELQADIAIPNIGDFATLLAGYSSLDNYYLGGVYHFDATTIQVFIFRRTNGVFVEVPNQVVNVSAITGPIKFRVEASKLTVFMNGVAQVSIIDSTITSGSVGFRAGSLGAPGMPAAVVTTTIDNFSATALPILPFTDAFPSAGAVLSGSWVTRAGGYATNAAAATDKAKGTTAANLATLGRLDVADVDVQATVAITNASGNFAALTARVSSAVDPDFYQAVIYYTGTQLNADIFKKVGGIFTQLGTSVIGSITPGGTLFLTYRFTVIGGQLTLFNSGGVEKVSVSDFSLKSGSVGIRSSLDPAFDDFSATKVS